MTSTIPSDAIYKFVDCKYTGVVITARRARRLLEEDPKSELGKPVTRAFREVMEGQVNYHRNKEGTK
jgi:DNA-directed RNA polymerase subunit K/omega